MADRAVAGTFWLYMLELANGHLYTGYARDVGRRYVEHLRGRGARTTRMSAPLRLAGCWKLRCTVGEALRLEAAVKRAGRARKEALLADPASLRALARKRGLRVRVTTVGPDAVAAISRGGLAAAAPGDGPKP